jgi:hypothetical protein
VRERQGGNQVSAEERDEGGAKWRGKGKKPQPIEIFQVFERAASITETN